MLPCFYAYVIFLIGAFGAMRKRVSIPDWFFCANVSEYSSASHQCIEWIGSLSNLIIEVSFVRLVACLLKFHKTVFCQMDRSRARISHRRCYWAGD